MKTKAISRRELLKAGGALVVSFSFWDSVAQAFGQETRPGGTASLAADLEATQLDSWLAVAQDGTVTVFTSKVELGTGVETALAQMVAEELDVPFRQIKMDTGDTSKTVDQGMTVAARTIERAGPQLRQAAAAARQELLKLASARFQSQVEKLAVRDGVVMVASNPAKKISYGDIIGGRRFNLTITATGTGDNMNLAAAARAKDPKDYKIVGTSVPRVDLPPKFTGEHIYVHNVRIPGMLHGRVVRPPVVNSKPSSLDEDSIQHISGVVKVVQEGSFVGVVAKTEWAAIQAARALRVIWSAPTSKLPASRDELDDYLRNTKGATDLTPVNKGDVAAALAQGSRTFEATYRWPFQLHGMLGPSCAVADVQRDKVTIWTGTQAPFPTRAKVAKLLGIPEKSVRIIHREGSGCYGRLEPDDVPEDAVLMSRAVGQPVRVQWMRDDEHGWEPKGPPHLTTVRAAVDAQGKITAWDFLDRSFPWTDAGAGPLLASRQVGIKATDPGFNNGARMAGEVYDFDHQKIVAANLPWQTEGPIPLRTSNLRSPGEPQRCFASECFMDEIAAALHVDPVQFRLRYLSDTRHREVLLAATQKAAWKERPSPAPAASASKVIGRGVAIAGHEPRTLIAAVAEIEVDRSTGKVRVNRITLAHDCGLIINPDGVRNQVQGNVIQGVSRTLLEEVQFDASGVKSLDWRTYPVITFADVPDIDIVLINRPDQPPLGAGEAAIVAVPAAIGNAIFDATGVRLRDVPLTPQRVVDALKAQA